MRARRETLRSWGASKPSWTDSSGKLFWHPENFAHGLVQRRPPVTLLVKTRVRQPLAQELQKFPVERLDWKEPAKVQRQAAPAALPQSQAAVRQFRDCIMHGIGV